MDDFILFLSCGPFPPETKSSLGGKRHTARIQAVADEPSEELRQVSWSVRANPTIHALPHAYVPEALEKLIDYAKEKCPIVIYLILDEVPNEPWMVDILKLLIDRISPTYKRQVIVRLASSNPQEVDESVQELFEALGSVGRTILPVEEANPYPWSCYLDFCLPFESTVFSMIAHSKEPVSVDMYLPNTKRNAACFIDILWPNASSNLNLNNLTGIELEVILPGRVERALKSMLDGGLMILSTNGYMKTCYWALMPTEEGFMLLGLQNSPSEKISSAIEGVKQISTEIVHQDMFTDPNFNFERVEEVLDSSEPVTFEVVSLRDALKSEMDHMGKDDFEVKMQDIDAVYFSPGKIVANTKAIEDSVSSVATEAVSRSTPPSPIKRIMSKHSMPTAVVTERPFETASGSSKKASEIENIKRLNSITSRPRSRSRLSTSSRIKETVSNQKENAKQQTRAEAASAKQRLVFKRSSTSSTKAISRRATDSDLGGINSLRTQASQSLRPPATPVNSSKAGEFSGSEKKKIILDVIKRELSKIKLDRKDAVYVPVVRKLHEMTRGVLRDLKVDRKAIILIMENTVKNNAPLVIETHRMSQAAKVS